MGESEKYMGDGRLCERCIRKCANADCEKDYCENFYDKEEANAEIEAIRKRCYEKFMREVYAYVLSVQQKIDIIEKKLKK